ncbi:MAG: hypothetical protein OIN87_03875 [Candidatus Methanoperedens sp.]|nr:hypothetical protein [Candidatus Methanoperedens sp.]
MKLPVLLNVFFALSDVDVIMVSRLVIFPGLKPESESRVEFENKRYCMFEGEVIFNWLILLVFPVRLKSTKLPFWITP